MRLATPGLKACMQRHAAWTDCSGRASNLARSPSVSMTAGQARREEWARHEPSPSSPDDANRSSMHLPFGTDRCTAGCVFQLVQAAPMKPCDARLHQVLVQHNIIDHKAPSQRLCCRAVLVPTLVQTAVDCPSPRHTGMKMRQKTSFATSFVSQYKISVYKRIHTGHEGIKAMAPTPAPPPPHSAPPAQPSLPPGHPQSCPH